MGWKARPAWSSRAGALGLPRVLSMGRSASQGERPLSFSSCAAPPHGGNTPDPGPPLDLTFPSPRRRYAGWAASRAVHGALLAAVVLGGDRLWRRTLAPGAPALFLVQGGGGGGGGGNRVAYITLPSSPSPAPPPPTPVAPPETPPEAAPPPVEEIEVPQPEPPPVDSTPAVAAEPASDPTEEGTGRGANGAAGGGVGGGVGPGIGPGAGEGRGPGAGGEGGVIRPPELRDLAFPFETPPKELRGASLDVVFWVRVDGRVERYEVQPVITDRDYARKFDEVIRAFRFTPARAPDGSRIAGTTRVTFTLPGKRSS